MFVRLKSAILPLRCLTNISARAPYRGRSLGLRRQGEALNLSGISSPLPQARGMTAPLSAE